MCYGASVYRSQILRLELLLQAVTLVLYATVLFFGLTAKRGHVVQAPMSHVRIASYQPPFDVYNADYYLNFRVITWRVNVSERSLARYALFSHRPDGRYEGIDFEINMDGDEMASITAPLGQFRSWLQADLDEAYARPHRRFARDVGMSRFDAPWMFDLAVDANGFACDEEIYVYSYSYRDQDTQCTRVYDRDGSMGHHHTYGDYHDTTVHIAVAWSGEGLYAKPRLCGDPTTLWSDVAPRIACDVCRGRGVFRPDALAGTRIDEGYACQEITAWSGLEASSEDTFESAFELATEAAPEAEPEIGERQYSWSNHIGVLLVDTAQQCDLLASTFGSNCCEPSATPDGTLPPSPAPPPIHASLATGECLHVTSFNLTDPVCAWPLTSR